MERLPIHHVHERGASSLTIPSPNTDEQNVVLYGTKAWLEKLRQHLYLVGPTEARVIITGETGTGKTTLARAIHLCHPKRAAGRFRRTNVGALVPELAASQLFGHVKGAYTGAVADHTGIVEESDGGTFFMDEVAAAADNVQVMLLTLLETTRINKVGADPRQKPKEIDARFIAATTLPIDALRDSKRFRKDLFFRIAEYHIAIPRLRDCQQEIPQLAQAFLAQCQRTHRMMRFQDAECTALQQIEDAAVKQLQDYQWPGNVRELQSVIRAAVVRSREDPQETILRTRHLQFSAGAELAASGVSNFDEYPTWRDAEEGFHRKWMDWALQRCGTAAEVGRRFRVDQKTIKRYRGSAKG